MKKIFFLCALCASMAVMAEAPTGAINGKFTINANGDQVYFSQGNLQYQASTNTWRFAEHQYDRISDGTRACTVKANDVACSNLLASATYDGWVDLFAWGTSGWDGGNAINYQPWSMAAAETDARIEIDFQDYGYGPFTDANLWEDIAGTQYDWGMHNAISNGGNQAGLWRTLTKEEWNYILYERPNADSLRSYACVLNVKTAGGWLDAISGWVLLSDDYRFPLAGTDPFIPRAEQHDTVSSYVDLDLFNAITTDEHFKQRWCGLVFLPFAGYREDATLLEPRYRGHYWTSSIFDDWQEVSFVDFSTNDITLANNQRIPFAGLSVRLVQDAPKSTTACANVQSDKQQSTKVLRNGQLLIERGGKTYNAQGVELK